MLDFSLRERSAEQSMILRRGQALTCAPDTLHTSQDQFQIDAALHIAAFEPYAAALEYGRRLINSAHIKMDIV